MTVILSRITVYIFLKIREIINHSVASTFNLIGTSIAKSHAAVFGVGTVINHYLQILPNLLSCIILHRNNSENTTKKNNNRVTMEQQTLGITRLEISNQKPNHFINGITNPLNFHPGGGGGRVKEKRQPKKTEKKRP